MLIISELTPPQIPQWDEYVKNAPGGLPQHLSGWREVLQKTNGYQTCYLLAQEDNQVVGVLPLFIVRSKLMGVKATTIPGGLCANNDTVAAQLIERGREMALEAGAKQLHLADSRQIWPGDFNTASHHQRWLVRLEADPEAQWKNLRSNLRRQVRIARKNGLRVEIDTAGHLLDPFYDVFSRFTHQMGTPVFGRNFLAHTIETFPGGFNIVVVFKEDEPIGGYFQLQMNQTMYGMWGASLKAHLALRPVYLAYWELFKFAIEQGFGYVDMGRSPTDSPASKYKAQWGGTSSPVYQQVMGLTANAQPQNVSAQINQNRKFKLFMQVWPRLPLPVTRYLGPKLRRHVPFA